MKRSIFAFFIIFTVLIIIGCDNYGEEKYFNGTQLFYTSNVTEREADRLGQFLIDWGFADGEYKTVQLNKTGNTYEFRMVVKTGIENDPVFRDVFRLATIELSDGVFDGANVDIHLCNDRLKTLSVVPMMRF